MDDTLADRAPAKARAYIPPPVNGDFYRITDLLDQKERAVVKCVRDFMEAEVAPIIEDYWARDQFPHEIIPKLAALDVNIAGVGYQGYGAAGGSWLLSGLIAMELARVNSSIATFWGVHTGLSAGSIYLCGDETQKQRWLPPMMRWETDRIVRPHRAAGGFGDVGRHADDLSRGRRPVGAQRSKEMDRQLDLFRDQCHLGAGRGFRTGQGLRRREGQPRFLRREDQDQDGAQGGAEWAHHASGLPGARDRSTAEGQHVQGLRQGLANDENGRRVVRSGLRDGRVRTCVRYAVERKQFGRPIGGFQLVQDLLVRMLGNVTACQAMMLRLAQLQDQGLMEDEHASLAKAFTTVKCRETVGYARELLGGNGICLRTTSAVSLQTPRPSIPMKARAR